MKVSVITAAELGRAERLRWELLQGANPLLASPFFSHEFTEAAAAARQDVRIGVMEQGGRIVGFFPHQRRWGAGAPVGGRLCDHQGVIAAQHTRWDWKELLAGCGLAYWQFDHLQAGQQPPVPVVHTSSPGLDLSQGFDAWWKRKRQPGGTTGKLQRMANKIEREVGPLRFEIDCRDPGVFATILRLKSEKCRRTGQLDFFAWPWTRALVEHVRGIDKPSFGGRLSALFAGDRLVAAHFGMRSREVWHWWFPVYSQEHGAYAPGLLLLLRLAEGAAAQGHRLVDLGKGDERYKASFSDCASPLVEGIVTRPAFATLARGLKKSTGHWLRTSPLAQPLQPLLRQYRRAADATGA